MDNLFVRNEDAPCYTRPIHGKGALALGKFQLERSFTYMTGRAKKGLARLGRSLKTRAKF